MPENTTPNKRRLDPRGPFILDIRDLGRQPGFMRGVQRRVLAPAKLGLDVVWVPQDAPLALELRLESVTEGVLVTGSVTAPITGECGRCLDPVSGDFTAEICELFAYPDSLTEETTDQDEVHRVVADLIDLEAVVRVAVVLGLPTNPLCQPDCAGLCPDCGRRLDDVEPGHAHEVIDPRWAGLAKRFGDQDPST